MVESGQYQLESFNGRHVGFTQRPCLSCAFEFKHLWLFAFSLTWRLRPQGCVPVLDVRTASVRHLTVLSMLGPQGTSVEMGTLVLCSKLMVLLMNPQHGGPHLHTTS
jgi:hypothetical protein